MFSIYGTIASYKAMKDFNGHSKCSGFMAFSSPFQVSLAMIQMNGKVVSGKHIYVSLAKLKDESINATISLPKLLNPIGTAT